MADQEKGGAPRPSGKKGLWAPSRGYFEIGAGAVPASPAAAKPSPSKGPPKPLEAIEAEGTSAAPSTPLSIPGGEPGVAAQPATGSPDPAPATLSAAAAGAKPAAATAAAPAAGPGGTKTAAKAPAAKPEAKVPPPPKKDPLRDSVLTVPPLAETAVGKNLSQRIYDEPDSETTLYKVPSLNVLFAVSSALLLLYTVIVILDDYYRPWKTIQANWNEELHGEYEAQLAGARADQAKSLESIRPRLEAIVERIAGPEALREARAEADEAAAEGGPPEAVQALIAAAREGLDENETYSRLKEDLRLKKIQFTLREKESRAFKGDFQAAKFEHEEKKRHALDEWGNTWEGVEEIRKLDKEFAENFVKKLSLLEADVERLKAEAEKAQQRLDVYVKAESAAVAGAPPAPGAEPGGAVPASATAAAAPAAGAVVSAEDLPAVEARLELIQREVATHAKKVASVEKDWRTVVRNFPGLDFLAPSYRIEKVVLPDLHEDLNFQTVPRIDRCKTCHINIDNPDSSVVERRSRKEIWGTVYASHPRLDLFVGSSSPHPYDTFGCTTCHYGDGHSTDFITAAHTPRDEAQAADWEKRFGWERMHHQDYPMLEKKHIASSCFKCHPADHKLEGGEGFNLGYEVVKTYGCYGCHKIKAFEGFDKVGPSLSHIADKTDLRFLSRWIRNPQEFRESTRMPRFFDLTNSSGHMIVVQGTENETSQLDFKTRNGIEVLAVATYLLETSDRRADLRKVAPGGDPARGRELFRTSGCLGCHSVKSESMEEPGAPDTGDLVRAGLASLDAFIEDPTGEKAAAKAQAGAASSRRSGNAHKSAPVPEGWMPAVRLGVRTRKALDDLVTWVRALSVGENVEGLYHEVVASADELERELTARPAPASPVAAVKAAAKSIYERWVHNTFAPDLSSIGSKITNPDWLADWVVDPRKHDPETVMPRLRFEKDPDGEAKIADMVAYLMTLRDPEFEAKPIFAMPSVPSVPGAAAAAGAPEDPENPEDTAKLRLLDDIAFDYKRRDIADDQTRDDAMAEVKAMPVVEKLKYVGHRLIRRYGCYGCHLGIKDIESRKEIDVGGRKEVVLGTFDKAQPIGTELEGWGIKEAAKLDYGHWGHQPSGREAIDHTRYAWARAKLTDTRRFDVIPEEKKISEGHYEYAITNRLLQKTPEELLKMPLFPFAKDERLVDAAVTFLAGLVKDRIPLEKTHRLTEEENALEEGSRLIAKLNCQGCHRIGAEPQYVNVARLPRYSQSFNYDTSEESRRRDELEKESWLARAVKLDVRKAPFKEEPGAEPGPQATLELARGTLLNRKVFDREFPPTVVEAAAGVLDPDSETRILGPFDIHRVPAAARVLPVAGYEEGRIRFYFGIGPDQRPQAPPPLVREGERVRGDWLFRFLLDVKEIRPWLRARMPSFYLSQDDARTIVRWFRVNAGVPESNELFDEDAFSRALALHGKDLFGASVGDRVGFQCNSCHPAGKSLPTLPVLNPPGKFDPEKFPFAVPEDRHYVVWEEGGRVAHRPGFEDRGAAEAWAKQNLAGKTWAVGDPWSKVKWGPDLGMAAERLRPAWLRAWLSEPQDFMPGTNMPAFFGTRDPVKGIELKPGDPERIDALIQYLVHMKAAEGLAPGGVPQPPAGDARAAPGAGGRAGGD